MLTPINREVLLSFVLQSLLDFVCLFPFSSQGKAFCIVVASCRHVSLIVDQLDWQCCRTPLLHCCGVVFGITGESLRNLKIVMRAYCHLIDSHRHRSVHTRVVHGSGARGKRLLDVIGINGVAQRPATCQWCANLERRYFDSSRI